MIHEILVLRKLNINDASVMILQKKPNPLWNHFSNIFIYFVNKLTLAPLDVRRCRLLWSADYSQFRACKKSPLPSGNTFWRVKKLFLVFIFRLQYSLLSVHVAVSFAKWTPFRLWQKPKLLMILHDATTASVVPLTCCACT